MVGALGGPSVPGCGTFGFPPMADWLALKSESELWKDL